jgi:hypothetical protein
MWIIKTKLGEQLTEQTFKNYDDANEFLFEYLLNEYGLIKDVLAVRSLYFITTID